MQTLEEIQLQFRDALLTNDETKLDFIASSDLTERFAVYRQTVFENLKNALQITFPGIWILLGKECADSVAYTFIKQIKNLPNVACLDDWGFEFSNFFETIAELNDLPYLKDVALIEWFKHLSYCAKDVDSIEITVLQQLSEEALNQISFNFQPSMFLLQSQFPLQNIFNIIENPNASSINLNMGSAYAVITRINYQVSVHWISKSEWYFLHALKQGNTLQQAYDMHENVDITKMIVFMFDKKLVRNFVCHPAA